MSTRIFTHYNWFTGETRRYRLVRESPAMVWGLALDGPDDLPERTEPRRFSKHTIRFVEVTP